MPTGQPSLANAARTNRTRTAPHGRVPRLPGSRIVTRDRSYLLPLRFVGSRSSEGTRLGQACGADSDGNREVAPQLRPKAGWECGLPRYLGIGVVTIWPRSALPPETLPSIPSRPKKTNSAQSSTFWTPGCHGRADRPNGPVLRSSQQPYPSAFQKNLPWDLWVILRGRFDALNRWFSIMYTEVPAGVWPPFVTSVATNLPRGARGKHRGHDGWWRWRPDPRRPEHRIGRLGGCSAGRGVYVFVSTQV